jgi:polysaccharide pyruvyl transferase WcaK-like protein
MKGDLLQSVDPVLWQVRTIAQQHELLPTDGHLLIIPRHNSTDSFNDALQDVFTDRDWSKVTVVSMEPNNQQELTVCQQIAMQCPGEVTLSAVSTLEELVEIVADAEHVVSQRLHGAIAAIGLGRSVDIISQRKNDKLDALAQLALKPDVLQQKIDNVEEVMSVLQQLIAL